MSPKHAPKCQETARLGENRCFGKRRQRRFLSSQMTPKLPLGNSGTPLDQPWKFLKFSIFFCQISDTKVTRSLDPEFSQTSGGIRRVTWIILQFLACLHGMRAVQTPWNPEKCVQKWVSQRPSCTWGPVAGSPPPRIFQKRENGERVLRTT